MSTSSGSMIGSLVPRRIVLERVEPGSPPMEQALHSLTSVFEAWIPDTQFTHAGDPPMPFTLDAPAISRLLDHLRAQRARGVPDVFRLASADDRLSLFLEIEPTPVGAIASVWLPWPEDPEPASTTVSRVMDLLGEAAERFGAFQAFVEQEEILMAQRARRAAARARAAVPAHLRRFVPEPLESLDELPELLLAQEIDRTKVPPSIWWVSYWGPDYVRSLGPNRVAQAGWARMSARPDGGVVVAATDVPLDAERPDHMAGLWQLIENLDLRREQERHRLVE